MKNTVRYEGSREAKDRAAMRDLKAYLQSNQWDAIMTQITRPDFQTVNILLSFTGVEGFPVHAFGRKYMLKQYRQWMLEGGIATDEYGYKIEEVVS